MNKVKRGNGQLVRATGENHKRWRRKNHLSKAVNGKDPILALSGVGKEIWKGVNADEYVRKLRQGW